MNNNNDLKFHFETTNLKSFINNKVMDKTYFQIGIKQFLKYQKALCNRFKGILKGSKSANSVQSIEFDKEAIFNM